ARDPGTILRQVASAVLLRNQHRRQHGEPQVQDPAERDPNHRSQHHDRDAQSDLRAGEAQRIHVKDNRTHVRSADSLGPAQAVASVRTLTWGAASYRDTILKSYLPEATVRVGRAFM